MNIATLIRRNLIGGAVLSAALALVGCGGEAAVEQRAARGPTPLTSVALDNGATADFYEPEPGRLVFVGHGDLGIDTESLEPLAIYERLTKKAAPQELRDANTRADAARAASTAPADTGVDDFRPPMQLDLGVARQALTASQFSANWCGSGLGHLDFDYCWTNVTNNYSIDLKSASWIHAHADGLSGTFYLTLYYKDWLGNWIMLVSDTVSGSLVSQTKGKNDTYRVEISNAVGDTYHLSIHGEK